MLNPTDFFLNPSGFQSQMLQGFVFFIWVPCIWSASNGGVCSSSFSATAVSLHPPDSPWVFVVCDCMSVLPTFFSVPPSLNLAVESLFFCPSDHFLYYWHWCGCYPAISMSGGEHRRLFSTILPESLQIASLLFFLYLYLNWFISHTYYYIFFWVLYSFIFWHIVKLFFL